MGRRLLKNLLNTRKKRILFGICLFLLIIIVAGIIILHSNAFKSYLIKRVDQYLQSHHNLTISTESFDYSLARLAVTLEKLRVKSIPEEASPLKLFSAQRVHVNLSFATLFLKKVHIQQLHITEPRLELSQIRQQPVSSTPLKQSKNPTRKKPIVLRIDDFVLDNGSVVFNNQQYDLQASLSKIIANIQYLEKEQIHKGLIQSQDGEITLSQSNLILKKLLLEFNFDSDSIQVAQFLIDSDLLAVEASGWMEDYQDIPRYLLEIRSSLQLDQIQPLIGLDNQYSGNLAFEGAVQGEGGHAKFSGKIRGQDAVLNDIPIKRLEVDLEGDKTALSMTDLSLDTAEGNLKGILNLPFDPQEESSVAVRWDSINLLRLGNSFPNLPLHFSSKIRGQISARWQALDFKTIDAEGDIAFDSSSTSSSSGKKSVRLDGQIKFKASNESVEIYPSSLSIDDTSLSFAGNLEKTNALKANFHLRADDLSKIENLITRLKKDGNIPQLQKLPPFQVAGRFSLSGKVDGTLAAPKVSLYLDSNEIAFNQMQIPIMKVALAYGQKHVDVSQLLIEFEQGQIEGKGRISYDPFKNIFGEKTEFKLVAKELNIASIVSSFPVEYAVQGLFSGEARLSGSLFNPEAEFKASLSSLIVDREDFSRIEIEGDFKRKHLQLTKLGVFKGEGALEGTLGLNLPDQSYTVNLTGKNFKLTDFKSLSPESITGKINLNLNGQGTFKKPEFAFELLLEEPSAYNRSFDLIKFEASSDGTTIKSRLSTPAGQTALEARLLLQEPYIIHGNFSTTSLDAVNMILGGTKEYPTQVSSEIKTSASFSVPLKNWEDSTMDIEMDKAAFIYRELIIQNSRPIVLSFKNQELVVQDFQLSGPNTEFTVSGKLPFDAEKRGRIEADGAIQLKLVEPFLSRTRVNGTLFFQSQIMGSLTQPRLNAQIELKEGGVISPLIPYNLHDFVLLAKVDEDAVNLEKFSVGVDEGNISAHGKLSLAFLSPPKLQPISLKEAEENDIEVTLTNLNLSPFSQLIPSQMTQEFGGLVEGAFHIRGNYTSPEQLEVEGELSRLLLTLSQLKLENESKIKFSLKDSTFRLEELRLSGGNSSILATGSVYLANKPEIDASLSAKLDSAVLASFLENMILGGMASLDINIKGQAANPVITGNGELKDGFFEVLDYPFLATNVNGSIQFSESSVTLTSLQGILNGGTVDIKGKLNYHDFKIESARAEMTAQAVQMNYPEGLQAQASGTLSLEGINNRFVLSGNMKINQAYYGMNIYPGGQLISNIRFRRAKAKSEIPPLLQKLDLDIGISTLDSFVIDNNLARLELDANVRLMGTVLEPRLSGRVSNRYTGELIFSERTFEVEQASIDFLGTDPLDAYLNVVAHTNMTHNYDELEITLTLSGPINKLNYSLTSSPPRSQSELASLLITGYGTEKLKSETANIIGNQMILYFASPLASPVTERIKNLIKAEEVTIEPINIATEEDPGARFTFRKGLVKHVDVVYSIDVSNTQQQTWILDYNLNRNFSIWAFRKDDGSYGSSLSHRFFLTPPVPSSPTSFEVQKRLVIKEIKFEGNSVFPLQILRKKIRRLKIGSPFNYGDLRKSVESLISFYKKNRYLNVVINPTINYEKNKDAIIILNISARKPVTIIYKEDPVSQKLKDSVVSSWNGRLPEDMAIAEAKRLITRDLKSKGFYEAKAEAKKDVREEQSIYTFTVEFGPHYRIQKFEIKGKSSIDNDTIRKEISKIPRARGKGLWFLLYDFKRAVVRIKYLFEEKGYLNAEISPPQANVNQNLKSIHIILPIEEGPQSMVRSVEIKGNQIFSEQELKKDFRLRENSIYRPSLLSENSNSIYDFYRTRGYQDVNVGLEIIPEPESPDITLVYTINEGELHTIAEIEISGNRRTPDHFIRRELLFTEGDPVNMETLILSQKKLYDLSIFKSVSIHRLILEDKRNPEKILVEVQENPRFALAYGLRYNSEEKFEGFGQLDFINLFGRGRNGLLYYRQNQRQKDLRFSLKDPYLFGKRFNMLHSFYYFEETEEMFKTEEIGYTIQQEVQLPFDFSLSYLYRLSRIHTYELESFGPFVFDITLFLSELQTFLVRDTRINKLNARQGSFFSLSLTYSPEFLGSDLTYISIFCQYSLYKALGSRIIWASNYRIGLADAFDQVLIPSKRFYAGGGNSVRGFKRRMVGPLDPFLRTQEGDRIPEGGEAVFIMNQELRFPVYKWLEGVTFYDVGNVYENFSDFNPFDVRQSIGFGLRLNTPAVLLRLDYGINFSPHLDEAKGVFFFSIGQAF
jgi:outer membrane protein assembly complex protein YaeT